MQDVLTVKVFISCKTLSPMFHSLTIKFKVYIGGAGHS